MLLTNSIITDISLDSEVSVPAYVGVWMPDMQTNGGFVYHNGGILYCGGNSGVAGQNSKTACFHYNPYK